MKVLTTRSEAPTEIFRDVVDGNAYKRLGIIGQK